MDKKLTATIFITAVLLAVSVTASSSVDTPLFIYRMEQSSIKMHFLPTTMNTYIYTTEKGYYVNYDGFGIVNDGGGTDSVINTCGQGQTCDGGPTCQETCWYTCVETSCQPTCPATCIQPTCETCDVTCGHGCLTAVTETC
jgi:hypothetical protein